VKELVHENRRITIRNVADTLRISSGSVQNILKHSLNMRWIASRFVPCRLSEEQENCVGTCQDLQGRLGRDPEFLLKITTRAMGLWVHHRNQETVILVEEPVISTPEKKQDKFART
jgi:hypothetical protein